MQKHIFILFLLINSTIATFSQSTLETDLEFFKSQIEGFEFWMQKKGLDKHFVVTDLKIEADKLNLYLRGNYDTPDSMAFVWRKLKQSYDSTNLNRLPEEMIDFLAFQMEVDKDSVVINIQSQNQKYTFLTIIYSKGNVAFANDQLNKAISRSFGSFSIKVDELRNDRSFTTLSSSSLYKIRRQISQYMVRYFKDKGTRFWHKAEYDVLKDNYNELTFEVTNLTYEVLNDVGYFEYLQITIKVEKKGDEVVINYIIKGKYGSGILRAPRRGDYKNMEPKYTPYLERYQNKLETNIRKILTN